MRGTAIHQDGQTRRTGLGGNSILHMLNCGAYRTSEQTFPAHIWTSERGTQERNLGWENSWKLSVCTWWVTSWECIGSHKESTPWEEGGYFVLDEAVKTPDLIKLWPQSICFSIFRVKKRQLFIKHFCCPAMMVVVRKSTSEGGRWLLFQLQPELVVSPPHRFNGFNKVNLGNTNNQRAGDNHSSC